MMDKERYEYIRDYFGTTPYKPNILGVAHIEIEYLTKLGRELLTAYEDAIKHAEQAQQEEGE